MKTFLHTLAAVALLAVLGITQTATAQSSATIQARATVQAALAVTSARDLNFGTVTAGTPGGISVGTMQPEAGRWDMTGDGNKSVSLTFTLPTQLNGTGTPVPINSWSGLFSWSSTPEGNAISLSSGQAYNFTLAGGFLWVFIGATITPPVGASGNYSAPIVLTVAYL